ncbi:MAG: hypothetical protein HY885_09055 [Deltaproteobacteria bacterium]|nr:hypothetical protein [Deltaproteobacteria bacterium]
MSEQLDWKGALGVTGCGMVSPVGLSAPASLAAMRAGVTRITELPGGLAGGGDAAPEPLAGGQVPVIPAGRQGVARLVRLACAALQEAVADAGLARMEQYGVFLGGPVEKQGGRLLDYAPSLSQGLSGSLPPCFGNAPVFLFQNGRAAALLALRAAAQALSEGRVQVALVGGVDSWVNPLALKHLADTGRLRGNGKSSGILPGEGAAFFCLERLEHARDRKAAVRAELHAAVGARDETPFGAPCKAVVLSRILKQIWPAQREVGPLIISDLNGERHRHFEWMLAASRSLKFKEDTLRHWHPAEYIGDSGAASGALCCAWAATALSRGYACTDGVIVWGGSDEGEREAVLFVSPGGGE